MGRGAGPTPHHLPEGAPGSLRSPGGQGGGRSAKPPAAPSGAEPLAARCTGVRLQKDQPERSAGVGGGASPALFLRTPVGLDCTQGAPALLGEVLRGSEEPALLFCRPLEWAPREAPLWHKFTECWREREDGKKHVRETRRSGWCVFPRSSRETGRKGKAKPATPHLPKVRRMGPLPAEPLALS